MRGAASNPPNRFERLRYDVSDLPPDERPAPRTRFFRDDAQTIIVKSDTGRSLNPYRGCEHGCAYCFARDYHEFLGFSAGLDFETKILVKENAPALLRRELLSPRYRPAPLTIGTATDPYQPIERRLQLTRRCLEVLAECRHPITLITKNHLVARDVDLLAELAKHEAAFVWVSLITLDATLAGKLEPRCSRPTARLVAIQALAKAGVPVGVLVAPVIPGLTDHEIPAVVKAVAEAGAKVAGMDGLRLPRAVATVFEEWLAEHYPDRQAKVLAQMKDKTLAEQRHKLFGVACRRAGLTGKMPELSTAAFRRPAGGQLPLL
jgi:DNA repair photolyase